MFGDALLKGIVVRKLLLCFLKKEKYIVLKRDNVTI